MNGQIEDTATPGYGPFPPQPLLESAVLVAKSSVAWRGLEDPK
jgi:hypothetical protein